MWDLTRLAVSAESAESAESVDHDEEAAHAPTWVFRTRFFPCLERVLFAGSAEKKKAKILLV